MSERGKAPLYAMFSTKDVNGGRVVEATLGNTQGFGSVTIKTGTNHGGLEIVAWENGDFELRFIPWKSPLGTYRGTKRLLSKGNLRDIEELFPATKTENLPLWEQEAHKDYAKAQKKYD